VASITQKSLNRIITEMDQMLPSPGGFSIPSIGTPLHQPEEDQQILPNALQQQQQSQQYQLQQLHSMSPNIQGGMLMITTPQKTMHTYAPTPAFATPQSLMQPQTPVI
jgi:transcription initiation factor TFIID TATA-box-binding protein